MRILLLTFLAVIYLAIFVILAILLIVDKNHIDRYRRHVELWGRLDNEELADIPERLAYELLALLQLLQLLKQIMIHSLPSWRHLVDNRIVAANHQAKNVVRLLGRDIEPRSRMTSHLFPCLSLCKTVGIHLAVSIHEVLPQPVSYINASFHRMNF